MHSRAWRTACKQASSRASVYLTTTGDDGDDDDDGGDDDYATITIETNSKELVAVNVDKRNHSQQADRGNSVGMQHPSCGAAGGGAPLFPATFPRQLLQAQGHRRHRLQLPRSPPTTLVVSQ